MCTHWDVTQTVSVGAKIIRFRDANGILVGRRNDIRIGLESEGTLTIFQYNLRGTKNNKCDVNFFNFDFDLKNQ